MNCSIGDLYFVGEWPLANTLALVTLCYGLPLKALLLVSHSCLFALWHSLQLSSLSDINPYDFFDILLSWTIKGLFSLNNNLSYWPAPDRPLLPLLFLSMLWLNLYEFSACLIVDYWSIDAYKFFLEPTLTWLNDMIELSFDFYSFTLFDRFRFSCTAFYSLFYSFYKLNYCLLLLGRDFFSLSLTPYSLIFLPFYMLTFFLASCLIFDSNYLHFVISS